MRRLALVGVKNMPFFIAACVLLFAILVAVAIDPPASSRETVDDFDQIAWIAGWQPAKARNLF